MTPERWQRITELFEAARQQPATDRARFLGEACNGDQALREEVESLLSEHERAGSFIANPALGSKVIVSDQEIHHSQDGSSFAGELTGQLLGHYKILEKLGQGGMGVVYKAQDTHLDRLVAVKVLPSDKVADPESRGRFVQEAKAASALNHPNIVTVHDIASEKGIDFIAMEYVPGKTLDQLIPLKGTSEGASGVPVQFFSFATGEIKTVATVGKAVWVGLAVAPDARWLLYTAIDQQSSDLMLVENFR